MEEFSGVIKEDTKCGLTHGQGWHPVWIVIVIQPRTMRLPQEKALC